MCKMNIILLCTLLTVPLCRCATTIITIGVMIAKNQTGDLKLQLGYEGTAAAVTMAISKATIEPWFPKDVEIRFEIQLYT
jgi:hypothetical protein